MKIDMETLTLEPGGLLTRLERAGFYTIESHVGGTGYVMKDGYTIILRGVWGAMGIRNENLGKLIEELQGIKELADIRKRYGVKGA